MQHGYVALPKSAKKDRISENLNIDTFAIDQEDMDAMDNLDEHLVTGNTFGVTLDSWRWTLTFFVAEWDPTDCE